MRFCTTGGSEQIDRAPVRARFALLCSFLACTHPRLNPAQKRRFSTSRSCPLPQHKPLSAPFLSPRFRRPPGEQAGRPVPHPGRRSPDRLAAGPISPLRLPGRSLPGGSPGWKRRRTSPCCRPGCSPGREGRTDGQAGGRRPGAHPGLPPPPTPAGPSRAERSRSPAPTGGAAAPPRPARPRAQPMAGGAPAPGGASGWQRPAPPRPARPRRAAGPEPRAEPTRRSPPPLAMRRTASRPRA